MTQPRLTSTHKRVLGSAGAVIVVVAFALLLPKIANYRSVLDVIGTLSLPWLIDFRWRDVAVWADGAFGLGLSRGLAKRDEEARRHRSVVDDGLTFASDG